MAEKAAGEDTIVEEREEAPPPRGPAPSSKRKRAAADGVAPGASMCDDVVTNIFARLPARTAVACTALSKHHRGLIRSPEFTSLHRRLGAPLPSPHIAYLATAPIRRRPEQKKPVNVFHAFHVAGIGGGGAPMRSLAGWRYLGMSYINTCNGVVLLANKKKFSCPCRCVLWNPAVADGVTEVTVPDPWKTSDYQILGLGYGRRSETYKLLLCHKGRYTHSSRSKYSLAICSVGDVEDKEPTILSTELSAEVDKQVGQESLYADGTIYLLEIERKAILAFNVDDETVTSISLPTHNRPCFPKLMELSGRPCLAVEDDDDRSDAALWLLSPDHQWVRRCLIAKQRYEETIYLSSLKGVWDFGDMLLLHSEGFGDGTGSLFVYNIATGKMLKKTLHRDLAPDSSEYTICWGYKPTLVSPGSIIGNMQNQAGVDQSRRELPADMVKALQLVAERDGKKGHKATLDTVCFMNILVCIMQRLPDGDVQGLLEMLTGDPGGPACGIFRFG
ncbi:unnamed protein product [Urochloa decumbens]|uniref:F-box associated beta-propeller type 3 domain-containing protein n=1 Tax=Urochloa decumbens TaxID=240449 RepID=A0ABC9F4Y4_9POAL